MDEKSSQIVEKQSNKRWVGIVMTILLVVSLAVIGIEYFVPSAPNLLKQQVEHNNLNLDLTHPDVLIESASLSQLPQDLLTMPLLRDTLTEDFVFYYQHNADKLGLLGSIRRIVYEHQLEFKDSLLQELLDQPATIALWQDKRGRLKHYMIVLRRGGLARALQPLLFVASKDSQLSRTQLSQLRVNDSDAPIYQLSYNGQKSLLFASQADQLLLLSSADLMFKDDSQAKDATEIAEAALAGSPPWAESFGLAARVTAGAEGQAAPVHRIALGARYLALGYQRLMPVFAGARFEMTEAGWNSFLALNDRASSADTSFDFSAIWQTLPRGAGACVTLPLAQGIAQEMLKQVGSEKTIPPSLAQRFTGAAGLCWYAESRLFTPLLVSQIDGTLSDEEQQSIGELFDRVIGAAEHNAEEGIIAVETEKTSRWQRWQREVSSSYGQYEARLSRDPDSLSASRFFRVTLARDGNMLLFSLDDKLVEKAQQVIGKNYPSMAESLPTDRITPLYLAPDKLAKLILQETFSSLPQKSEPIFFNAAQTLLLPKLKALSEQQPYVLTLPVGVKADKAWQWLPLQWQAL